MSGARSFNQDARVICRGFLPLDRVYFESGCTQKQINLARYLLQWIWEWENLPFYQTSRQTSVVKWEMGGKRRQFREKGHRLLSTTNMFRKLACSSCQRYLREVARGCYDNDLGPLISDLRNNGSPMMLIGRGSIYLSSDSNVLRGIEKMASGRTNQDATCGGSEMKRLLKRKSWVGVSHISSLRRCA